MHKDDSTAISNINKPHGNVLHASVMVTSHSRFFAHARISNCQLLLINYIFDILGSANFFLMYYLYGKSCEN